MSDDIQHRAGSLDADLRQGSLYDREFWGISRHELIAGAAEELISSANAREQVRRLLAPLGGFTLADVAGWADTVKRRARRPDDDEDTVSFLEDDRNRNNSQWHFVNLPLDAKEYSRQRYPAFTRDEDIVQILAESVHVLQGDSDRYSELNALRLAAHLVGDVHQPIHVGCGYLARVPGGATLVRDPEVAARDNLPSDRGGNNLLLPIGSRGTSLHSYWDSRLGGGGGSGGGGHEHEAVQADVSAAPQQRGEFVGRLLAMINQDTDAADVQADEADRLPPARWAERWASESLITARSAYHSLAIAGPNARDEDKFDVTWEGKPAYDARCKPLVDQQMQRGARNLAALLDAIWP